MRRALVFLATLAVSAIAHAATLHVPGQYPTIQDAIDAGVDGDTVLVAPETYVENIHFMGKIIAVQSSEGPGTTVIDGNQQGSVVTITSGSWQGVEGMVLDGFTITNGTGHLDPYGYRMGGGIYCFKDSPWIVNNIIRGNQAVLEPGQKSSWGGGIECCDYSTEIRIINNEVYDNWAVYGGGIHGDSSMPVIAGNIIHHNQAESGGGIYLGGWRPRVVNNLIYGNNADKEGGGISMLMSRPFIKNNTLHGNSAGICGGGMLVFDALTEVSSSIFWNNTAPADPQIHGNPEVSFCNIQGGWPGTGNIDQDPLFVDPSNGDFLLQQDPCQPGVFNPCVDAGKNLAFNLGLHTASTRTDGVCDADRVDMGFHLGPCCVPALEVDAFEISQGSGGAVRFSLFGGEPHASREYLILGGISGTEPGTPLPGGQKVLPVNWDMFTSTVANVNLLDSLVFVDFLGVLDQYGQAAAVFDTNGPLPGSAGVIVHFACLLKGPPWDFASNAAEIRIIP